MNLAEKASIDEAFIDLTLPVRKKLLERFPDLAVVPADAPLGLDTPLPLAPSLDWTTVDWGIVPRSIEVAARAATASQDAIPSQGEQVKSPISITVAEEVQGNGWADMALWIGGELMEQIRKAVEDQLGYTTSAVRLAPSLNRGRLDLLPIVYTKLMSRYGSLGHRSQQGLVEALLGLQEAPSSDGAAHERRCGFLAADEVSEGAAFFIDPPK